MSNRTIVKAYKASNVIDDLDMHLRRALPTNSIESLSPFVFLGHTSMPVKRELATGCILGPG